MHIALYKIEFQYLPSFSDSCENPNGTGRSSQIFKMISFMHEQ